MKTDHPAWGYRRAEDGRVESKLFPEGRPEGWVDSPARVPEADEDAPSEADRVIGEPSEGKKRRNSAQVNLDEAFEARAALAAAGHPVRA